jgi:Uma2 family endonuclease
VRIELAWRRPISDADLLALAQDNPGYRFERTAEGRLVVSPNSSESSRQSGQVFFQLEAWNRETRAGVTFDASAGFTLPDGSVRSPDAAWVARARWNAIPPAARDGFAPLCPDVVFEVASPSDRMTDLETKMAAYVTQGARLAVLIDGAHRTVTCYRPGQAPERYDDATRVSLGPELPGFVLDCEPIWG